MTTTGRSLPASPEGSSSGVSSGANQPENKFIPRVLSFTEGSMLKVPLDIAISVSSPYSDNDEQMLEKIYDSGLKDHMHGDTLFADRPKSTENYLDGAIGLSPLTQPNQVKSKRSSSASNDLVHERDRFRARFETFNPPKSAIIEDQLDLVESGSYEYEEISSKTKKLNIEAPITLHSLENDMELSESYVEDNISPLDRDSSCFKNYQLCPGLDATKVLDLRMITPKELSTAFAWYFNNPLPPTSQMFPWLHGLHPENFAQRSFFGSQSKLQSLLTSKEDFPNYEKPESARFIMCVETSGDSSKLALKTLRNTVAVDEILQRIEVARSEVRLLVKSLVNQLFPQNLYPSLDVSSFTDSVIQDCLETGFMPAFIDSDPRRGVSLRNFHIQVNKAAKCADFVVYCDGQLHEQKRCLAVARLLKVAQIAEDIEHPFRYDVFYLEHHENSETQTPEIWTVKDNSYVLAGLDAKKKTQLHTTGMGQLRSDTFGSWDADYQVKEKFETTVMSAATKLCLNVWLGNLWDHQVMMLNLNGEFDFDTDGLPKIVPIERSKDNYCDPENSLLTRKFKSTTALNLVTLLPPPRSHWQLFVHCHNDASFPSQKLLNELLFKYTITSRKASEVTDIHLLDFPSSGSLGFGDCRQENLMSIVNTCKLLYLYSSSVTEDSLASLIYCSDGYTELSLLIFCFLIYAEDIPLETAMLKLHLDYGRPFYVFNSDVQVLRKLEVLLRKYSPKRLQEKVVWSQSETITQQEINEILLKPKRNDNQTRNSIPRKFRLGYIASESSDSEDDSDSETENARRESALALEKNWVEDLEGSLPSRILPYIYLGSLKHANNLTVLSKLGITKIISVGESLDWLKNSKFVETHDIFVENFDGGSVELFNIKSKSIGTDSSSDVTSVMKLNNLRDDGIDDLSRSLPRVLEYIDQEYKQSKGQTKFLVHCRVGVSRSATVVIAEVMKRLGLNLPQAYLYVRVRRLNIVIQPNLRFMYELFKWEETKRDNDKNQHQIQRCRYAKDLRVIDWFVMCQEIKKLNMPFIRQ